MRDLVKKTGETITLNTITGDQRICIEVFDTPSPLMSIVGTGEQRPLLSGATGKILLAHMNKVEIDRIYRKTATNNRPIGRRWTGSSRDSANRLRIDQQ